MTRFRNVLAGLLISAAGAAAALQPTSAGYAPTDPSALISIPDMQRFYAGAKSSPLAKRLEEHLASEDFRATETFRDYRRIVRQTEEESGLTLWPDTLFGELIRGVDIYLVQEENDPEIVFIVKCASGEIPATMIKQIEMNAEESSGVALGYTADTVDNRETWGFTIYALPAFDMYMAQDKEFLLISSNEKVLVSSLRGLGTEFFQTDFFEQHVTGLGDVTADLWAIGEFGELLPLFSRNLPARAQLALETAASSGVMAAEMKPGHIKLTTFVPTDAMDTAAKRIALAAPPPGDITVYNFFDPNGIVFFGTNYFDGEAMLEQGIALASEGGAGAEQSLNQQLTMLRARLGFDIRTDLLANLGPDLGFSFEGLTIPNQENQLTAPQIDALLAVKVRNNQRFDAILTQLEAQAEDMMAGATGESPVTTKEVGGNSYKVLQNPMLSSFGVNISYAITAGGYFLLSLNEETLAGAITRRAMQSDSVKNSAMMSRAQGLLQEKSNSLTLMPGGAVAELIRANRENLAATFPDEGQAAQLDQLLEYLTLVDFAAQNVIFLRNGRKEEIAVVMKPSDGQ